MAAHERLHAVQACRYRSFFAMSDPAYHILHYRQVLQTLEAQCSRCILQRQVGCITRTGPVYPHKLRPCNTFCYSTGDVLGPYYSHEGRLRFKIFLSIIHCDVSNAIHLYPLRNYSGKSLATHLEVLGNLYAPIRVFSSDYGGNYLSMRSETDKMMLNSGLGGLRSHSRHERTEAAAEKAAAVDDLTKNIKELQVFAGRNGLIVNLSSPYNHSRQGSAEISVKLVKQHLSRLVQFKLDFSDWLTLCSRIGYQLNSRPLSLVEGTILSRQSFLGEVDQRQTFQTVEQNKPNYSVRDLHDNILAVHKMTEEFNKELFVIRLKYYQKLHNRFGSNPQVKAGDVVSVSDMVNQCKNYSLAIVQKILPSTDGQTRDALILMMRSAGRNRNPYNPSVRPQLFQRNVESLLILARRQEDGTYEDVVLDEGLAQATQQLQTRTTGNKKFDKIKNVPGGFEVDDQAGLDPKIDKSLKTGPYSVDNKCLKNDPHSVNNKISEEDSHTLDKTGVNSHTGGTIDKDMVRFGNPARVETKLTHRRPDSHKKDDEPRKYVFGIGRPNLQEVRKNHAYPSKFMAQEEKAKKQTNKYLCNVPTSVIGTTAWYQNPPVSKDYFKPKQVSQIIKDGEAWTVEDVGRQRDVNGGSGGVDGAKPTPRNVGQLGDDPGLKEDRGTVATEDSHSELAEEDLAGGEEVSSANAQAVGQGHAQRNDQRSRGRTILGVDAEVENGGDDEADVEEPGPRGGQQRRSRRGAGKPPGFYKSALAGLGILCIILMNMQVHSLRLPINHVCPIKYEFFYFNQQYTELFETFNQWKELGMCYPEQVSSYDFKKLYTKPKLEVYTVSSAVAQCKKQGGRIASVTTLAEFDHLKQELTELGFTSILQKYGLSSRGDKLLTIYGDPVVLKENLDPAALLPEGGHHLTRASGKVQSFKLLTAATATEAHRLCRKSEGSLLIVSSREEKKILETQWIALKLDNLYLTAKYDPRQEHLYTHDGMPFFHETVEKTIIGENEKYVGIIVWKPLAKLLRAMASDDDIERGGRFVCLQDELLDVEDFIVHFDDNTTITPESYNLVGVNTALLCEFDVNLNIEYFRYQLSKARTTWITKKEAITNNILQLHNLTDTSDSSHTADDGNCWAAVVSPRANIENFTRPRCISSQPVVTENAARLAEFCSQIEVFQARIVAVTAKIQASRDVSIELFYHGRGIDGMVAYFKQIKFNFLSYLIISNLLASLLTVISGAYWMRNRACLRASSRRACGTCLQPVMTWCCTEESSTSSSPSPSPPPRRTGTRSIPYQTPLALTYESNSPATISD